MFAEDDVSDAVIDDSVDDEDDGPAHYLVDSPSGRDISDVPLVIPRQMMTRS